jgi:hypothetical protein
MAQTTSSTILHFLKQVTVYNYKVIAEKELTPSEMKNYADENELDYLGFEVFTKNDDGTFSQDVYNSDFELFHSSSVLFSWQEKYFN